MSGDVRAGPLGKRAVVAVAVAVGIAALVALLAAVGIPLGDCGADRALLHPVLQLAGDVDVANRWIDDHCPGSSAADVWASLWIDSALAVTYGALLTLGLHFTRHAWRVPWARRVAGLLRFAPGSAAALDLAENVLLAVNLSHPGAGLVDDGLARWALTASSAKWVVLTVGIVATATSLTAFLRRPPSSEDEHPGRSAAGASENVGESAGPIPAGPSAAGPGVSGICLSGGGVRSAGFSLGVLESLEGAGRMDFHHMSAVSGGAYAGVGWTLRRHVAPDAPAAAGLIGHLLPEASTAGDAVPHGAGDIHRTRTAQGRHRYLAAPPASLGRSLAEGAAMVAFGVVVMAAVVVAAGVAAGAAIRATAELRLGTSLAGLTGYPISAPEHWFPGAVLIWAGAMVAIAAGFRIRRVGDRWVNGWTTAVGAALLMGLLLSASPLPAVGVPLPSWGTAGAVTALLLALAAVPGVSGAAGRIGVAAILVGGILLAGMAVLPWLVVSGPTELLENLTGSTLALGVLLAAVVLLRPSGRRLVQAGGVVLAVALLLTAGMVMDAVLTSPSAGRWAVVAITGAAGAVALVFVDLRTISLFRLYRDRLTRAFTPPVGKCSADPGQVTWEELAADAALPELIVCAAVHRTGLVRTGSAAETFTITPHWVRQGTSTVGRREYLDAAGQPLLTRVASWMAVTGAAFASAMGLHSIGSTNALLAAFNLDLGIWLPNVDAVVDGRRRFPHPGLGYTLKEILGLYDDEDDLVFVADGGHWENLGLAELFRRGCTTIVCVDASADPPGSYTVLRRAIERIRADIAPDLSIDLAPLDAPLPASPLLPSESVSRHGTTRPWSVIRLPFSTDHPDRPVAEGSLVYAKLQLADDLPPRLRRFALADRRFPHYPTGNQLLDDQQFRHLVDAGRHAGDLIVAELDTPSPPAGSFPAGG